MIEVQNGIFGLHGDGFSCLLRVNDYGLLEQLHFGAAVQTADAPAFFCRSGLGWGESILLKAGDTASCPDVLPLAFSNPGRGDYRESPLELAGKSADLHYESYRILEGDALIESGLPQARGASQTLVITLTQENLKQELYFSLFPQAITRRCVLKNTSDQPLQLTKLMSMMLDLPGDYHMTTFDGGWIAEMRKHSLAVLDSRIVNESSTGFSSHRHNPGFLLSAPDATEDSGTVYGFNLVYSGNHYASAQRSLQGLTRVMQGISPASFHRVLQPQERFETSEVVLCWSDGGFGGLSERMHRFVQNHIIPPYWRERPRPVLYNSWEGCMFDFNRRRLLGLASQAKKLGCELFVLDDGWFGSRNSDTAGLGDYNVNLKKLPGGLEKLAEKVNAMGMEFGLWFEPESVNLDSDLYRSHPDWALTDAFEPLLGRNQLLLDLSKEDVQDYIVRQVTGILDSAPISCVKWDMNRHSVALGTKAHDYILGLYKVLDRIFRPRPQSLINKRENRGKRFLREIVFHGFDSYTQYNERRDSILR